ncbi:radical SAM protein [bacterium]|nr:radical SAM protein [bacterium]
MTKHSHRILFLQLPRLETDMDREEENIPLAGFYLSHVLRQVDNDPGYSFKFLSPQDESLDDTHLLALITQWQPETICATLYLWNIERTLHILKQLKNALPPCQVICGGPEVAKDHPFLLKALIADVIVMGEGEPVFTSIIKSIQTSQQTNFKQVAWKQVEGYKWGKNETPVSNLKDILPQPNHPGWQPDSRGMAYLESSRGCPRRCSYCRYSQMRKKTTYIESEEILHRVKVLKNRGANQIRFIDPTLNANPDFEDLLGKLRILNSDHSIRFFAELQADLLSPNQITLLAQAGFFEVEVGVQSLDQDVLRNIHRPVRMDRLEQAIQLMTDNKIKVTIDLLYGLPDQDWNDVIRSLEWARRFQNAYLQCMQTLLLPGTEIRKTKDQWGIKADDQPPYGVQSTHSLTFDDIRFIEERLTQWQLGDGMTQKFVGYRLPDLFKERIPISLNTWSKDRLISGQSSRRTLVFQGQNLYSQMKTISAVIKQAIAEEPHMLWQFLLKPEREEPLDLLQAMIREIQNRPSLWLDRFAYTAGWDRLVSRRVFIQLIKGHDYSKDWIQAAETLLEDSFY